MSHRAVNPRSNAANLPSCWRLQGPPSPVIHPIKQLVAFTRISLKPGESRQVRFVIHHEDRALHYWDVKQWKFVAQPGTVKVLIGASSLDIRLRGKFDLRT